MHAPNMEYNFNLHESKKRALTHEIKISLRKYESNS